eukprot:GFYU01004022.1.p1 GENE.GFYU01004022.1~~GFYU01004022.1.p1  ORF type:complete len:239 (+),score=31.37 GFYU01004022.1:154-870(+)
MPADKTAKDDTGDGKGTPAVKTGCCAGWSTVADKTKTYYFNRNLGLVLLVSCAIYIVGLKVWFEPALEKVEAKETDEDLKLSNNWAFGDFMLATPVIIGFITICTMTMNRYFLNWLGLVFFQIFFCGLLLLLALICIVLMFMASQMEVDGSHCAVNDSDADCVDVRRGWTFMIAGVFSQIVMLTALVFTGCTRAMEIKAQKKAKFSAIAPAEKDRRASATGAFPDRRATLSPSDTQNP